MTRTATLHPSTAARVALLALLLALCCALVLGLGSGNAGAQGSPLQKSHLPHVVRDFGLTSTRGGDSGCDTGIQAQNLSAERDMSATFFFYPQNGDPPFHQAAGTVPPLGSALLYLPTLDLLHDGLFAAIVTADRPVGSVARTDCVANGKAAMYGQAEPGLEVLVPLIAADYYGQCSILSVQNPDTAASIEAEIELLEVGEAVPEVTLLHEIGPGTSVTLDLCRLDLPGRPALEGFVGSARVTAGDSEVAAQAYVDIATSDMALYAYRGVPAGAAANQLYVPLFRSRQRYRASDPASPTMDTGIAVVNPGDQPTNVTVMYYGAVGNPVCGEGQYEQGPITIPAKSSAVFYQGPAEQPVTGVHPLPEGCIGSAKIVSDPEPVLAIVNDSLDYTVQSAAYNAFSGDEAGRSVVLPLFRAGHTSWQLYTGVSVMNTGNELATVTIEAIPAGSGTAGAATATVTDVGVNETALFWPPDFANRGDWANPSRSYGSAIVTSDQPVVVIVNDVSLAGKADSATYNGIKVE